MFIFFILGLLLGGVAVIFILQNVMVITVTFFAWQLQGSLALVLALAVLAGILVTLLVLLPETVGNYFSFRDLKKENKRLEEDLRRQKELTVFAGKVPPSGDSIKKIEEGAIDRRTS